MISSPAKGSAEAAIDGWYGEQASFYRPFGVKALNPKASFIWGTGRRRLADR